jgi:hypothetical protein
VDHSGFYVLPMVVRTYAPIGQTRVLHEELSRDHLSAMSGITLEGKLLNDGAAESIQRARCGSLFETRLTPNFRQTFGDLGWLADPPQPGGEELSERWRGGSATVGTVARLCS